MDIDQKIKFNSMILEMRFLRLIDKYLILSISFKKINLALGVIGDHYFMGTPPMFANIERHIRNIFIGNVPKIPEEKRKQYISSVDMAPTILQASGAYWGSSKFGLGSSIFSKDKSIIQRLAQKNTIDI